MNLPTRRPYSSELLYPNNEAPNESYEKFKKENDIHCENRLIWQKLMTEKILDPYWAFWMKYQVLKIALESQLDKDKALLYNILQDSLRQNISDLSELVKKFIEFTNSCKNQCHPLFKKKAQKKIIDTIIALEPEQKEALLQFSNEIDEKRLKIFTSFDDQGKVTPDRWDSLKNHLTDLSSSVRRYRDTTGSHDDKKTVPLPTKDVDKFIDNFEQIIFDFYTVLSFAKKPACPTVEGFPHELTTFHLLDMLAPSQN